MDQRQAVAELVSRWRWSPDLYVREDLGDSPRPWQGRVLRRIGQRFRDGVRRVQVVLLACPGAGKDRLAAWLVHWVMKCHPHARAVTMAQRWESVDKLLWSEIRTLQGQSCLAKEGFGSVQERPLYKQEGFPDWMALGTSAERGNAEALRGHHSRTFGLRITDEASAVPREFRTMTQGLSDAPYFLDVSCSNAWASEGWFYELASAPPADAILERVTLPDLVAEGTFSAEYAEDVAASFGGPDNPEFRALYLCEFLTSSLMSRLRPGAVAACVALAPSGSGERTIGVDVGRSTDGDPSAICWAEGVDCLRLTPYQVRDVAAIARQAMTDAEAFGARRIVVDANGVGAGVVDLIRDAGWSGVVEEFVAGSKAGDDSRFANRATEAAWGLIDRVNAVGCHLPDLPDLARELGQVQFEPVTPVEGGRHGGRWRLAKAPSGARSPNLFDAMMMATAGPRVSALAVYASQIGLYGKRCHSCRGRFLGDPRPAVGLEVKGRRVLVHEGCQVQEEAAA